MLKKILSRTSSPLISHYILLSLFFFAGLEVAFAIQRLVYAVLLVLIAILVAGIFVIRYEELGVFSPYQAILPSLAVIGLAAFALFLPVGPWLHAYIALAAICTYYVLKHGAKQAYPTWNVVVSLITFFVVLATLLGARFHFYVPIPVILICIFLATALTSVQFFLRYTTHTAESWLLATAIAFTTTEIAWTLQFLPLHYLVQAGVLLTTYYVGTQLTATTYEHTLTRREVTEYLALGSLAMFALLLTARWQ